MYDWMAPLPVRDAYDALTRRLGYPTSETLRLVMQTAMSLDDAQLLLELPGTVEALAGKLKRDPGAVAEQLERMYFDGLVLEKTGVNGSRTYLPPPIAIEGTSEQMLFAIGGKFAPKSSKTTSREVWARMDEKSRRLCDLWNKFFYEEWYRWQRPDEMVHRRLGGAAGRGRTYGVVPAVKALEKSEALGTEALPEWDLREFARRAEKGIYCRACPCRIRDRGCDMAVWVCWDYYEGNPVWHNTGGTTDDRRGYSLKLSGEEWLEVMVRGEEDHMMVHIGFRWTVLCNCCHDCCDFLKPLILYTEPWEGVHPSPYRAVVNQAVCQGCIKDCVPRCAFKVFKTVKDPSTGVTKPYIAPDKCVGCGQCVIGCKVQGALKLVLAEAAGAHLPVQGGRAALVHNIKGLKPSSNG